MASRQQISRQRRVGDGSSHPCGRPVRQGTITGQLLRHAWRADGWLQPVLFALSCGRFILVCALTEHHAKCLSCGHSTDQG